MNRCDLMSSLKLSTLFSDHMILQRGQDIPLWGQAEAGALVQVEMAHQKKQAKADENGHWMLHLSPMQAGGPYSLTISCDGEQIAILDVLVGDVFLAGGQSNMEWSLDAVVNADHEIALADYPQIRYYNTRKVEYDGDVRQPIPTWCVVSPQTAATCSAVGYFFAKEIHLETGVPVGILGCNWGGTSASCWMDQSYLEKDPSIKSYITDFQDRQAAQDKIASYDSLLEKHQEQVSICNKMVEDYASQHSNMTWLKACTIVRPPWPDWPGPIGPKSFLRPSGLYQTMLKTIVPYGIAGVIYYQGESDEHKPHSYATLFTHLIENWRHLWNNPHLPFYFVQLTNFGNGSQVVKESWAVLREQQAAVAATVPHTYMAVTIDCGDKEDIHPANKAPVGHRLALLARANQYGQKVSYNSPSMQSFKSHEDTVVITMKETYGGLSFEGQDLQGFEVGSDDGNFVDAKAEINGDTIIVHAPKKMHPLYVRYGYRNYTLANLQNAAGLPAIPFRTDHFA